MSAPATKAKFASTGTGIYAILTAISAVVLILSNIGASKGVVFGSLITDGGFFLFPLAYIIGDVMSEVYGFKASRKAVFTTFALSAFASVCYWVIMLLPAAEFYTGQTFLEGTFLPIQQTVAASLCGFLVGNLSNDWIMVLMKKRSGEKLLFGRIAVSTIVGEFLDTLVFCSIAASAIGINTFADFLNYLLNGFLMKTGAEFVLSPITMLVIKLVKQLEPEYQEAAPAQA